MKGHHLSTRHIAQAERLMLGALQGDQDMPNIIGAEVNDCAGCWRKIALNLAVIAAESWVENDDYDQAMQEIQDSICEHLDEL